MSVCILSGNKWDLSLQEGHGGSVALVQACSGATGASLSSGMCETSPEYGETRNIDSQGLKHACLFMTGTDYTAT